MNAPTATTDPQSTEARVSLLGMTDHQTVAADGRPMPGRIEGVEIQYVRPHVDARGMLVEVVNFSDPFWREPVVYSYAITVDPGKVKGWGMHLRQVDRHHVHSGRVRFVLYDARIDSPTHGCVQTLWMGDEARGAVRIPNGVWHALQNVADVVAHVTNFPTVPYDRAAPDKQLLPLDTELIPFDFSNLGGYGR